MKKIVFFFVCLFALLLDGLELKAQQDKLPAFSMVQTDGNTYSTASLKSSGPIVLIYFAPDCEHCQTFMKAYFKNPAAFKHAEVLMVTFKPLTELKVFETSFATKKYSNIHTGTEARPLYLQTFFNLSNTPFIALYNRHQTLVTSYKKETTVDDLIKRLKSLK